MCVCVCVYVCVCVRIRTPTNTHTGHSRPRSTARVLRGSVSPALTMSASHEAPCQLVTRRLAAARLCEHCQEQEEEGLTSSAREETPARRMLCVSTLSLHSMRKFSRRVRSASASTCRRPSPPGRSAAFFNNPVRRSSSETGFACALACSPGGVRAHPAVFVSAWRLPREVRRWGKIQKSYLVAAQA